MRNSQKSRLKPWIAKVDIVTSFVPNLLIQKAALERNHTTGCYDLHMVSHSGPAGTSVYKALSFAPVVQHINPGEHHPSEPFVQLNEQSAQALLDALWAAGLRPSSGGERNVVTTQGHELALACMKDHLADLRRIAFGQQIEVGPDTPRTTSSLSDHY